MKLADDLNIIINLNVIEGQNIDGKFWWVDLIYQKKVDKNLQ